MADGIGGVRVAKWYEVDMIESFYDEMVGKLIEETPKTYKLYFGKGIGEAIFYKFQVKIKELEATE